MFIASSRLGSASPTTPMTWPFAATKVAERVGWQPGFAASASGSSAAGSRPRLRSIRRQATTALRASSSSRAKARARSSRSPGKAVVAPELPAVRSRRGSSMALGWTNTVPTSKSATSWRWCSRFRWAASSTPTMRSVRSVDSPAARGFARRIGSWPLGTRSARASGRTVAVQTSAQPRPTQISRI